MSRPPLQWWVRAGNRAYGPYPSERLPGFVREGRLTPETSVANDPSGPWWPAGRNPSLDELFAPAHADVRVAVAPPPTRSEARDAGPQSANPSSAPASRPAADRPAAQETGPAETPRPAQAQPAAAQTFVVFVELGEGRDALFASLLAQLGSTARARPGVWLLRTGADAAIVRNALSQALGEGESLIVVRAEAADAAWFNLGGEADRALRALWLQPATRSSRA